MKKDINILDIIPIYNQYGLKGEDSGLLEIVDSNINDQPITGRRLVLQRIYVAILMTPETLIDSGTSEWGGGIKKIIFSIRSLSDAEIRLEISDLVDRVEASILSNNEDFEGYEVESIDLIETIRKPRGFSVRLSVVFQDGYREEIDIPMEDR